MLLFSMSIGLVLTYFTKKKKNSLFGNVTIHTSFELKKVPKLLYFLQSRERTVCKCNQLHPVNQQ